MATAVAPEEPITAQPAARLFPASARAVVVNYASAAALLVIGFALYATLHAAVPYYTDKVFSPIGMASIQLVLLGYLLLLPLFYATFPDDHVVKCRLFWRAVANLPRRRPTAKEAVAVRAVAVKAFFMPLMIAWLGSGLVATVVELSAVPLTISFYELMLGAIILIDLSFFTVAYGVEHPRLGNEIRSVEPTLLGWASALVCYPPLQFVSVSVIGWHALEYPAYSTPGLTIAAGLLMLALMGTYTWASVALGLKASNLTNRGTVDRGPYRWVRHPAYVCKNAFWWVAGIPMIVGCAETGDWAATSLVALSLAAWTTIYAVRAFTEERHLLADPDYRAYCERVKWRFIPGVF